MLLGLFGANPALKWVSLKYSTFLGSYLYTGHKVRQTDLSLEALHSEKKRKKERKEKWRRFLVCLKTTSCENNVVISCSAINMCVSFLHQEVWLNFLTQAYEKVITHAFRYQQGISDPYVVVVQLLNYAQLFATLWTAARQVPLSFTISQSLLFISIELVMPSNHLIFCCSLLLLPSVFPSIRVFSNELARRIKWPKYWSFSFSPSNEYSRLASIRID